LAVAVASILAGCVTSTVVPIDSDRPPPRPEGSPIDVYADPPLKVEGAKLLKELPPHRVIGNVIINPTDLALSSQVEEAKRGARTLGGDGIILPKGYQPTMGGPASLPPQWAAMVIAYARDS
jgi:hypothetical protein